MGIAVKYPRFSFKGTVAKWEGGGLQNLYEAVRFCPVSLKTMKDLKDCEFLHDIVLDVLTDSDDSFENYAKVASKSLVENGIYTEDELKNLSEGDWKTHLDSLLNIWNIYAKHAVIHSYQELASDIIISF